MNLARFDSLIFCLMSCWNIYDLEKNKSTANKQPMFKVIALSKYVFQFSSELKFKEFNLINFAGFLILKCCVGISSELKYREFNLRNLAGFLFLKMLCLQFSSGLKFREFNLMNLAGFDPLIIWLVSCWNIYDLKKIKILLTDQTYFHSYFLPRICCKFFQNEFPSDEFNY